MSNCNALRRKKKFRCEIIWSEIRDKRGIVIKSGPIHLSVKSHVRYVGYIGHGEA